MGWPLIIALLTASAALACGDEAIPGAADSRVETADSVEARDGDGDDAVATLDVVADSARDGDDAGATLDGIADSARDGDAPTTEPSDTAVAPRDGGVGVDTAAPGPGVADPPIWFVHLSDTHITEPTGRAADQLRYLLEVALPALNPIAALHTGDLIDDGGEGSQWSAYDVTIEAAPGFPSYFEIVGNHDKKHEGADSWLSHSVTGRAGYGFFGQTFFDTPAGRARIIWTDTSDSKWNTTNVVGFFSKDQRDAVLALSPGELPIALTIVLGHHPMTGLGAMSLLGSGDRMREVLAATGAAAYLCGHVHESEIGRVGDALVVQAPSLGKPGVVSRRTGFALVAFDAGRPVAQIVEIDSAATPPVAWPLLIALRPYEGAPEIPAGGSIGVRALAFSTLDAPLVEARLAEGPWVALQGDGLGRFYGSLAAPAAAGVYEVELRATSAEGATIEATQVTVAP